MRAVDYVRWSMSVAKPQRKISAVVMLFFVAPLVAEFLLGDFPMKWLPLLVPLAPMYGGGAILIRETVRRAGRGWPSMLLLGAAYALLEEGLVTQSLFNPNYLKMHLLTAAYLPALGIGGWWTLLMLNVHPLWSMGVSIALVEALVLAEAESPWLGGVGDAVVGVVFVLGLLANVHTQRKMDPFVGSHAQLFSVGLLCVLLVAGAFLLPVRRLPNGEGYVPGLWVTGVVAFVLGMGVMNSPPTWGWGALGALLLCDAIFFAVVAWFSRRSGWSSLHTFSLAAGGALVYGLHAFVQMPVVPCSLVWARVGNGIFLAGAVGLIVGGGQAHVAIDGSRGRG